MSQFFSASGLLGLIPEIVAEIVADSIIWELFAKKSAECLNLRNSFITISSFGG